WIPRLRQQQTTRRRIGRQEPPDNWIVYTAIHVDQRQVIQGLVECLRISSSGRTRNGRVIARRGRQRPRPIAAPAISVRRETLIHDHRTGIVHEETGTAEVVARDVSKRWATPGREIVHNLDPTGSIDKVFAMVLIRGGFG